MLITLQRWVRVHVSSHAPASGYSYTHAGLFDVWNCASLALTARAHCCCCVSGNQLRQQVRSTRDPVSIPSMNSATARTGQRCFRPTSGQCGRTRPVQSAARSTGCRQQPADILARQRGTVSYYVHDRTPGVLHIGELSSVRARLLISGAHCNWNAFPSICGQNRGSWNIALWNEARGAVDEMSR